MRRCVISTFLLTLVSAYPGSELAAQSLGIKPPSVGDGSIVVTPVVPPTGRTASVDVFAACTPTTPTGPTGSSLLISNSQNAVYGPDTISLILINPLTAGQTLCVLENINDGSSYSTKTTVPTPVPAGA